MLEQSVFDREIDRVYATFGKSAPSTRIKSALWDKVRETDAVFFENACADLCRKSDMPRNLSMYFEDAWANWTSSRRASRRDDEDACAQGCEHGWFMLYTTEKPMAPFAFKCVCNNDPRFADQKAWTRAEIDKLPHLSWEDPFRTRAQREAWLARKDAAPEMDKVPF